MMSSAQVVVVCRVAVGGVSCLREGQYFVGPFVFLCLLLFDI